MNVTLFHPAFEVPGGAEFLVSMQARQLRAQGDHVSLLTFAFDPARWAAAFEGVPVDVVRKRSWTELFTFWSPSLKARDRARRVARALRGRAAALAYNSPCNALLGSTGLPMLKAWYCNEPPRPLYPREANPYLSKVLAAGGDAAAGFQEMMDRWMAWLDREGKAKRALDQAGVAGLDLVIAISEFSRDNARRAYSRADIEVVYPAVRFASNPPPRRGIDRAGLKVLVHSRLEPLKNVGTILRGFARFRQQAGSGCELHVVGEGTHRAELERGTSELGLQDAVRFHGFLPGDRLERIYAACDVMALLPLDEPFGLVFPEAMTRGLLAVGPSHGGPAEILDGGRLGWVCEALDPEAVADAFMSIWRTPDGELDRRRADADRACRQRFSPEVTGGHLHRALHRAGAASGAERPTP